MIQHKVRNSGHFDSASVLELEQVLMLVASHVGHHPCCCLKVDPRWSFSSQLLSIPFLWHRLPHLKKVSVSLNIFGLFFWNISNDCQTQKLQYIFLSIVSPILYLLFWSLKSYYNINLYNQYFWKKNSLRN
jgi:hypothetical protein